MYFYMQSRIIYLYFYWYQQWKYGSTVGFGVKIKWEELRAWAFNRMSMVRYFSLTSSWTMPFVFMNFLLWFVQMLLHVQYPIYPYLRKALKANPNLFEFDLWCAVWRKFGSRKTTTIINDTSTSTWPIYKLCRVILNPTHNKPHII